MSDEEDTTILLSDKTEDSAKTNTPVRSLPACPQPPSKISQNVPAVTARGHVVLVSSVTALAGIAFGYDMGVGSSLAYHVKHSFNLNCIEYHLIGIIWLIGTLLASFFGGIVVDGCGRRWAISCSAGLMVLGAILPAVASSLPLLLCGRLIGGFGGILSSVAQCVYAAEVSPERMRGRSVTMHQLGVAVGLLMATLASASYESVCWRSMVWLAAVPAGIEGLLALLCLPRSPHFQLLQMSRSIHTERPAPCCAIVAVPDTLLLALGLVLFQQLSGRVGVLAYAREVFVLVGVCSDVVATVVSITFGLAKIFAVLLSLCVVDKLGRRTCLIVGATCMMTSVALLGVISAQDGSQTVHLDSELCSNALEGFHYSSQSRITPPMLPTGAPPPLLMLPTPVPTAFPLLPTPVPLVRHACSDTMSSELPWVHYLAMLTLFCYDVSFSFSLAPITWLLVAEMFPAAVRGRAVAVVMSLHWLAEFTMPMTHQHLTNTLTVGGTLLLYSVVSLLLIVFAFLLVPETKGKSLNQVAHELKNMSLKTRMYQNLLGLPCLGRNEWLLRKARQYRQVSHSVVESTVI